jgi:MscS family membrane protein
MSWLILPDWFTQRLPGWIDIEAVERWTVALIILVAAFVLAFLVDWLLARLVGRWTKRTETLLDDRLIAILHGPVRTTVALVGLVFVVERLELGEPYHRYTLSVFKTVAIVVWLLFLLRALGLLLEAIGGPESRFKFLDERTFPLFENLSKIAAVAFGVYFMFLAWDIDVSALVASLGIAGIAVGFAARESLANLLAGVSISADAPYKVGDFIVLDTGERGRVTRIGLRSSRLLTRDDIEITIPNSVLAEAKIINESGGPWEKERIRIRVSVAYGSDLDQVYEVLLQAAQDEDNICEEPSPRVRFREFGDSGLLMELLGWIDEPVLRGRTVHHLNTVIYKRFQKEGIEIPFPQQDVHVKSWPSVPLPPAPRVLPPRPESPPDEEADESPPGEPPAPS